MTITEFLLARIAEDEAAAQAALGEDPAPDRESGDWFGGDGPSGYSWVILSPERAIAECEAKRRIVKRHLDNRMVPDAEFETGIALRALASVYADHPDFAPAWRT